jgi:hypothetical protein
LEQISESVAAFKITFRVTGGYRKAGTSLLERITGSIFTQSNFIEESINIVLDFFHKRQTKIMETISAH